MEPQGPICQSCSMPMQGPDQFGTEADGSKSQDHCAYCYKDGAYMMPDATMEQMIEISAKGWSDMDPTTSYDSAKAQLEKIVPHLERWRK